MNKKGFAGKLVCLAGVCAGLTAFAAAPALAAPAAPVAAPAPAAAPVPATRGPGPEVNPASAKMNKELAVCPGQTFAQPFEALKDDNYYTLVEGSEFNGPEEGWDLKNGAQIAEATRPDGSTGGVLDMPTGSIAISPPVCVTLQYPTARAYIENAEGQGGGVTVGVFYANAKPVSGLSLGVPLGLPVGQLTAKKNAGWELSNQFNVKPQLGGSEEGTREVRFVFANLSRGDYHLSGLYVDPRMS
ncbi:MAG TPA: hypothetical protein VL988_05315 [Solirubrobacteraceae bacterium]|nr:hypothetical protein [Solirubrobacteraceae bacterium]